MRPAMSIVNTATRKKLLIIDDDPSIHLSLKNALRDQFECLSAFSPDETKFLVQSKTFDIVLLDMNLSKAEDEGLELLPLLKTAQPEMDVIVVSGNADRSLALRSIEAGASGYLLKGYSVDQLLIQIDAVLRRRELLNDREHYTQDRRRRLQKDPIIGNSLAAKNLQDTIEKVKRSKVNVLIYGETGTGKELVARHIAAGDSSPFVSVDSATITSTMAESLLFGHEKGAFTGAMSQTRGLFEEANGGTIYFDEVANMPLDIQVKLLRVLQEKEIRRLGSKRVIPLDFRVICATNRDLEEMSQKGEFKYDLLHRIDVFPIRVPALRERREDIPELLKHFLYIHRIENQEMTFSDEALVILKDYAWPGNIRELSNVMAYLCTAVSDRSLIEKEDLPARILGNLPQVLTEEVGAPASLETAVSNVADAVCDLEDFDFHAYMTFIEGKLLKKLYLRHGANMSKFSKTIRMSRSHLYSKLNNHGIH